MTTEEQHEVINIAVVDDDAVVRDGLRTLLNNVPALQCIGVYRDVAEAMSGMLEHTPDILLLDVSLPGTTGIDAIRPMHERFPRMKIIMHSNYDHEEKILRARLEGAAGYVLKNQGTAALHFAILKVSAGGSVWPAGYAEREGPARRNIRSPIIQKVRNLFGI